MTTPTNLSVVKAFKLIQAVGRSAAGVTMVELAKENGMSLPTTHRLLKTLRKVEALRVLANGKYQIGSAVLHLASVSTQRKDDIRELIEGKARDLAEDLQETVHVAVRNMEMVRYIVKGESARSLRMSSCAGTDLEAYCTGLGKVFLASLKPRELNRYLRNGALVKLTPKTITDPARLRRELEKVRRVGFAIDNEEFLEGLRCIAVPIYAGKEVIAALSVSGPLSRIKMSGVERLCQVLTREAAAIGAIFERKQIRPHELHDLE